MNRIITVTCALLLACTASPQTPDPHRYPPPGKLVEVGGYRVHLHCVGEGRPTVMILGAGFSFDWTLVQREAANFTRVCTYDPSGSVFSDPAPRPTCDGRVDEIHTLLHNAGVEGKLVLVGHSIGAVFARWYAARYPEQVDGVVLVDHAGRYRFTSPEPGDSKLPTGFPQIPALPAIAPGNPTPPVVGNENDALMKLPPEIQEMHRWASSLRESRPDIGFYNTCMSEITRTAAARPGALGDKPLIVIANSTLAASEDYQAAQAGLLALSHKSKSMIAPSLTHAVPIESPGVIVNAIRQVVYHRL